MKLNKRILFITGSHTLSGSEIANINVAEVLKNQGAEIFYLVPPWSDDNVGKYIRSRNIPVINFRYFSRVYNWKYLLQALFMVFVDACNLFRIVKKNKITSIHISSEHYSRIFILYFLFSSRELVYRMGDAPNVHRALFRWIWRKILFRKVKLFVCVSQFIAGKIKSLGCPQEKIKVIYSFPFQRASGKSFSIPREESTKMIVSYAGQISPHKGVDILVAAAILLCQEREDIEFTIAGDMKYNADFSSELIRKIDHADVKDRIHFVGFIEDIFGYFLNSDLHLCPSVFEDPMPNVIFEAKSAGIPTVGFRSGGIPELIRHRVDGYLCEKKDVQSLLEGIQYFYNNDKLEKAKISAKGSLLKFGITEENFREQWIAVYG